MIDYIQYWKQNQDLDFAHEQKTDKRVSRYSFYSLLGPFKTHGLLLSKPIFENDQLYKSLNVFLFHMRGLTSNSSYQMTVFSKTFQVLDTLFRMGA